MLHAFTSQKPQSRFVVYKTLVIIAIISFFAPTNRALAIDIKQTQDLEYTGASFNEVWDVILGKNFSAGSYDQAIEARVYNNGRLPQYPVDSESVFLLGGEPLKRDALRTVNQRFDYYDYLPKKLHPNGVCVAGKWTIDTKTPFTGMLASGSEGLFIGRISVAMGNTFVGDDRGFGFAGKVFPTMDSNEVVKTGNFFTVDVLLGTELEHALDAYMTNEPETGFQLSLIGMGLRIASILRVADKNPGFRPLTQVAGVAPLAMNADGELQSPLIRQPQWIRLHADDKLKRNNRKDFRSEVLTAMQENKGLTYSIEVSNSTKDRFNHEEWVRIGEIRLNQAITSFGCDRRLHFSHPKM